MIPKVSIVVPVYGVEKYLNKCVDSLLIQTLQDIEIILVDDGSPDKCGEIAECYAAKDSRIKVIHQQNQGLGPARNTGIRAARGEYIGFVDSDDWANPHMFERLYRAAITANAEIAVGGHCDWRDGKIIRTKRHPLAGKTIFRRSEIDAVRKNLYGRSIDDKETDAFPMSVWIAIYKKTLFYDNDLEFKNILSEDVIFNIMAYKYANRITFTGDTDYCYRNENQTSIMRSFSEDKLKKYEDYLSTLKNLVSAENDPECLVRANRAAINCCRSYVRLVSMSNLSKKEKSKFISLYAQSEIVRECWNNYPINSLPFLQRIFQEAVMKGHYTSALVLVKIRETLKVKFGKY